MVPNSQFSKLWHKILLHLLTSFACSSVFYYDLWFIQPLRLSAILVVLSLTSWICNCFVLSDKKWGFFTYWHSSSTNALWLLLADICFLLYEHTKASCLLYSFFVLCFGRMRFIQLVGCSYLKPEYT